jgi:transcriptional antiterminator RfaH
MPRSKQNSMATPAQYLRRLSNEASTDSFRSLSWYALHTRPRQEERAAQNLIAWGVETIVPKLQEARVSVGTQILFPGYIFARFDVPSMFHKIRFTRGVLYVVSFAGRPASISVEVIAIQDTPSLRPGDPVMVKSGPLRSFVGVFERKLPGHARVQILLTTLAYSARMEVSASDLALLRPSVKANAA